MAVYKDSKGYYVKYRANGKSTTKRGFKTKRSADIFELKLKMSDDEQITLKFSQVAQDLLEYLESNTQYGSYLKSEQFINKIIIPNVKDKYIDKIDELDCKNFRDYVQTLTYSTTYKNAIIQQYKAIFKHAVKYYRLKRNPSICIDKFKHTREEKQMQREKEMNIWSVEDFNKFIGYVKTEPYRTFFILLFFTGMRLGECLALTWNDLHDSKIDINKSVTHKTKNYSYEIKEPKNNSSVRTISLNSSLYDYLMNYKSSEMNLMGFSNNWFIFGRIKPLSPTTIERIKNHAIANYNSNSTDKIKKIRLHDFRHSHASNLIANGVNIVAVSKRLGHSSIDMTLRKYTHLMQKSDDELINKLEECSQNVLKKEKKPYN